MLLSVFQAVALALLSLGASTALDSTLFQLRADAALGLAEPEPENGTEREAAPERNASEVAANRAKVLKELMGKVKAEAERSEHKAKAEEQHKAKEEAEQEAKAEAERKAQEEPEQEAKAEAESKAKAEVADRRTKVLKELLGKAKEEAEWSELKAKAEERHRAREEAAERRAKEEAERKATAEAENEAEAFASAFAEAENKAKEAVQQAKAEAEHKAKEEAKEAKHKEAKHKEAKAKEALLLKPQQKAKHEANARGDPHLINMYGQRFDIFKSGNHTLIQIPRFAKENHSLLLVDAYAANMGLSCADMYFQSISVTGRWALNLARSPSDDHFHGDGFQFQAGGTDHSKTEWMRFGDVLDLKIIWGRTNTGIHYLNILTKHLKEVKFHIGGLLGEDDHTNVATPRAECQQKVFLRSVEPIAPVAAVLSG